jgi:hypothetical protein
MGKLRGMAGYALIFALLFGAELIVASTWAELARSAAAQQAPSLKDTLEKGLKARRPEEFEFLAKVVELVEAEKLPLDVVISTFQWARPKKPAPMPYFTRAMQIRAAELGVEL